MFSIVTGQIAGTPAYMSPEVLSGAKPEPSSDIWALAIITCEMLTGHRPSFARNGVLLESSLEGILGAWRDFFNWSLAFEPSQRPEGVDAFLERFEQFTGTVWRRRDCNISISEADSIWSRDRSRITG